MNTDIPNRHKISRASGRHYLFLPVVRDKRLSQPQFAEHVHYCLHRRLVGHGDGCHV